MFENIMNFFKKLKKSESKDSKSKETAKERLHLVLMQDRANVSADFLEMMKQEIIEVIKKYIEVDEKEIDVRLTNEVKEDGTTGAPSLYANIPIVNIRNEMKKEMEQENKKGETSKKEETPKKEVPENKEDEKAKEEKKEDEVKEKEETKAEENKQEEKEDNKTDKEDKKEEDIKTEEQEVKEENNKKEDKKSGQ